MVAITRSPKDRGPDGSIPHLVCKSRITRVMIYARGAVITRTVEVPRELPASAVDLRIEAITPLAEAGSFRVEVDGREALGVVTELIVPEVAQLEGALKTRIKEAQRALADHGAERQHLEQVKRRLAATSPNARLDRKTGRDHPAETVAHSLAAQGLLDELAAELDEKILQLGRAISDEQKRLDHLQLEAQQRAAGATRAKHQADLTAQVRLASSSAPVSRMTLSYAVQEARWWPTYALALTDAGRTAELSLEALVAQNSLEDWKDATISLSTADLIQDARLPELTSLRLSKKQPPPKRGFRPPPEDLDELFHAYDDAVTRFGGAPPEMPELLSELGQLEHSPEPILEDLSVPEESYISFDEEDTGITGLTPPAGPVAKKGKRRSRLQKDEMLRASAAPPPPPMAMPASMPMPHAQSRGGAGAMLGGLMGAAADGIASLAEGAGGMSFGAAQNQGIEPADGWLDFDALTMASLTHLERRGRLMRRTEVDWVMRLRSTVSIVEPRSEKLRDPQKSRGVFDHRYDSEGTADVPSNGRPHRVFLLRKTLEAKPRFVSVPRMSPDVFREVELTNPLEGPILAGPVDVMLDGALLTTAQIEEAVDVGGGFSVGLGVEERVRIARNARVNESTVGMLNTSTAVDHEVTIDLVSGLGHPITVEILERMPVTDDSKVEISLLESSPSASPYDQKDRGPPIDGGLRWRLPLEAGGKRGIVYRYRIELPAKSEIRGGNRRD